MSFFSVRFGNQFAWEFEAKLFLAKLHDFHFPCYIMIFVISIKIYLQQSQKRKCAT